MTYPPQGPPGGQGPKPRYVPPPQRPGSYPPANQQFAPQVPYGQASGYYGQPPKQNTGLIIGLVVGGVALLAVAALVITGFWVPGFFLDHHEDAASKPPAPVSHAPTIPIEQLNTLGDNYLAAVSSGNFAKARTFECPENPKVVTQRAIKAKDKLHRTTPFAHDEDSSDAGSWTATIGGTTREPGDSRRPVDTTESEVTIYTDDEDENGKIKKPCVGSIEVLILYR